MVLHERLQVFLPWVPQEIDECRWHEEEGVDKVTDRASRPRGERKWPSLAKPGEGRSYLGSVPSVVDDGTACMVEAFPYENAGVRGPRQCLYFSSPKRVRPNGMRVCASERECAPLATLVFAHPTTQLDVQRKR